MNNSLKRLSRIAEQDSRLIIGLMSGTSIDGLDIALCKFKGCGLQTKVELLQFETVPYDDDFRNDVRSISSKSQVDLQKLTLLNAKIAQLHAEMILNCLKNWNIDPKEIDCIASHGQTIYHAPKRLHGFENYPNATLQIGDGDHIAVKTGIITLSDFRQKNIAAGGEGAPLALYGDFIIFSSDQENRVFLNIGGIANFTYLPADKDSSKIVCTDIGPGNTISDVFSQKYFNVAYDKDGNIARSGKVNEKLLETMLAHPFFKQSFPKTTGPELFNLQFIEEAKLKANIQEINPQDILATISALTAQTIVAAIKETLGDKPFTIYASGGGCHNKFIMEQISNSLPSITVKQTQDLGINPDAKEAVLFAVLANETLCDSKVETGVGPAVTMGKISLPS